MAVGTPVSLDSGGTATDGTSHATASITPTGSRVVIACGNVSRSTDPAPVSTLSGCGITWTKIEDQGYLNTAANPNSRVMAFWGQHASPSTGALTFDHGGITANGFAWSVFEVPGCDLTTPIVQAVKALDAGAGTAASVALATIGSADNGLIAVTGTNIAAAITPRTDWTEIHDATASTPNKAIETQYRLGVDDDASATWTGNARWAIIAFELAAAAVAGGHPAIRRHGMIRHRPGRQFAHAHAVRIF